MRILHVISSLATKGGGTTAAVVGMAAAQKHAGLDLAVAATWSDLHPPESKPQLEALGINVHAIGPTTGTLRRHPRLVPMLQEAIRQADVVHVHALYEEIQHQAARLSREMKKPYIVSPHGMLDPWSLNQSWLKKKLYFLWRASSDVRRAAAIHYTSSTERDHGRRLGLNDRAIVEPLGVDLGEFESLPARGSFRQQHPQLIGTRVVSYLGRIFPQKGLELLVPALAHPSLRDVHLVIIGPDQNYRATVEKWIEQHGVRERVIFTGILRGQARNAALVDSDLFALPSYHENFGVAVIEALACGVPVVVSDEVNIHQEINAAKVGGVVKTEVRSVVDGIARWLSDERLRDTAIKNARNFVWQNYDWNRIAQHWLQHYSAVLPSP